MCKNNGTCGCGCGFSNADTKPLPLKNSRINTFGLKIVDHGRESFSYADDLKPLQLKNSRTRTMQKKIVDHGRESFTYADDLKPLQLKNSRTKSYGLILPTTTRFDYDNATNPALCNMYPAGSTEFINCWGQVSKDEPKSGTNATKIIDGLSNIFNKIGGFFGKNQQPTGPSPTIPQDDDKDYTLWYLGAGTVVVLGGLFVWYQYNKKKQGK